MRDGNARIWDLQGRQIAQYDYNIRWDAGGNYGVRVALNADWTQIALIEDVPYGQTSPYTIKIWPIDTLETLLSRACQRLTSILTAEYQGGDLKSCPSKSRTDNSAKPSISATK